MACVCQCEGVWATCLPYRLSLLVLPAFLLPVVVGVVVVVVVVVVTHSWSRVSFGLCHLLCPSVCLCAPHAEVCVCVCLSVSVLVLGSLLVSRELLVAIELSARRNCCPLAALLAD